MSTVEMVVLKGHDACKVYLLEKTVKVVGSGRKKKRRRRMREAKNETAAKNRRRESISRSSVSFFVEKKASTITFEENGQKTLKLWSELYF